MKLKIALSVLAVTAVSVFAQPRLFVDNNVFDWGTTPEGTDAIKHTFVVVNKGTDTLRISNIRTTCGCTIAKYDTILAPGKTGNITAEFNKSGRTGMQEKVLTVYSNDADSAQIRLTLKGIIRTALDITPRWLQLYSDNGKVNGSVLFTTANKNLTIPKAQYSVNGTSDNVVVNMTFKSKSKPDANGDITYEFGFKFNRIVEKYENGTITFETNVKEKPSISMSVSLEPMKDAPY